MGEDFGLKIGIGLGFGLGLGLGLGLAHLAPQTLDLALALEPLRAVGVLSLAHLARERDLVRLDAIDLHLQGGGGVAGMSGGVQSGVRPAGR